MRLSNLKKASPPWRRHSIPQATLDVLFMSQDCPCLRANFCLS